MIAGATAAVQAVTKGAALIKTSGVVRLPVAESAGRDVATMPDPGVARMTVDPVVQSAVALTVALNPAVGATAAAPVTADCVETVAPVAAAAVVAVAVYAATATARAVVPVAPAKPAAVAAPSETADRTSVVGQDGTTAGSGATAVGVDSVRSAVATAEQTTGRTATDSELQVALATGATAAAAEKVAPGVPLLQIAGQCLTTSNRNCPKDSDLICRSQNQNSAADSLNLEQKKDRPWPLA